MKAKLSAKMWAAYSTEPIVNRIIDSGGSTEDCVEVLVAELSRRLREVIDLTNIAPRRIRREDGTYYVWHCPDELVTFTGAPERT